MAAPTSVVTLLAAVSTLKLAVGSLIECSHCNIRDVRSAFLQAETPLKFLPSSGSSDKDSGPKLKVKKR
jgi:hypothetical protein